MNKSEVFDLMIEIKKNYPSFDVSNDEVERYYKHLRDFPFNAAMKNIDDHIKTNTFPPKIAEIRGKLGDQLDSQRSKAEAAAYNANLQKWSQDNTPPPEGYWEALRMKIKETLHENDDKQNH